MSLKKFVSYKFFKTLLSFELLNCESKDISPNIFIVSSEILLFPVISILFIFSAKQVLYINDSRNKTFIKILIIKTMFYIPNEFIFKLT